MIKFSQAALQEIQRQQAKTGADDTALQLTVTKGGCLGLYYCISLTRTPQSDEVLVMQCQSLDVIIPSQYHQLLDGLVVDYSEDLMGGGFRFQNPNVKQTCSCSNSFSLPENERLQGE